MAATAAFATLLAGRGQLLDLDGDAHLAGRSLDHDRRPERPS
jgi:hypothetical protein